MIASRLYGVSGHGVRSFGFSGCGSLAITLACASLLVTAVRPAAGQDESTSGSTEFTWSDSLRAYRLGETIVVTADRPAEGLPARTEYLTTEDLERLPGGNTADVLKTSAGVMVSTGRKDEASITLRGFTSRRVAILVDGRPMNLPYYGSVDLASVSTDKLAGITVVRGPVSVTYGANAMGGVVNFVTARGLDRPGTRMRVSAGNHDTAEVLLTHGLVRGKWDLLLSARGAGSDGTILAYGFEPVKGSGLEKGGLRDNSDFTEWDLFGKLGYQPDAGTDVALSCGYHTQEKGVPGAIDEERYWRFTAWRRSFADVTLRHALSATTSVEAKAYGDVFVNTLVDYEDASYDPDAVFYNSTHDTWDIGGIVALEHDWTTRHHGTFGINLREDQIKKRMNPSEPWLYHHAVTGSVNAQHVAQLATHLWGSLGLADDFMVYNHLREVDHILGCSAGLTARPSDDWRICAALGRSPRFPTLSQLWGSQSGNRHLRAEVAHRFELGVDGRPHRRLRAEATIFLNDLTDLIDRDVRRAGRYYNIGSARSWGAEAAGTLQVREWIELQAVYTFTRTENSDTGDPLDLVPEHKVDGRLVISTSGGDTQWTLAVTRVGSRFDSEALTADRTLPVYAAADCRISTRVDRRLTLSLEVENIGDHYYEEEVMYPAPGRTISFSATLSI
jgi:iron complex outermembrane receptor protein